MADGDAVSRPAMPAGDTEPQTYLDDLEKAKALSLETLELDRLRRLKQMKGRERSHSTGITETMSSQMIKFARHKTVTTSTSAETAIVTKCRPRPGLKTTITLDKKLPPPPRRQSSGNVATTSDVQDLMVFSPAEKEKKTSLQELEASIGVVFDSSNSLFSTSLSETTTTTVLSTCAPQTPLTQPVNSFVMTHQTTSTWHNHSVHTLPSFSCVNAASNAFQAPQFAATVPLFAVTQPHPVVADSFRTCTSFPFPPTNSIMSVDRLSSSPSTFPPAFAASIATSIPTVSSSVWSSSLVSTPLAFATTPTAVPLTPESVSDSVLKFIEKKRNSNLIDLPEMDDALQHISSDSRKPSAVHLLSETDDLLKAFDPLLETCEAVPCPPAPPPALQAVDSQKEEDEQYAMLWNWAKETTKTSSEAAFEDNFEIPKSCTTQEERNDSPSPPPLPPRPKLIPAEDITAVAERTRPSPPRPLSHRARQSRSYESIKVIRRKASPSSELEAFCNMVVSLRSEFLHNDFHTNIGLVISPTLESLREESTSVKLVINSMYAEKPILFTCDVTTSIEHIISHVVCTLFDDVNVDFENFVLKVHGLAEYFSSDSALVDYEYVHHCQKFDEDVRLTLINSSDLTRPLSRTAQDDANDIDIKPDQLLPALPHPPVSQQSLSILLETFEREVEKMREQALKVNADTLGTKGVLQSVKAICAILSQVETSDMTEAIEGLIHLSLQFGKNKCENEVNSGFTLSEEEIFNDTSSYTVVELVKQLPNTPNVRMEVLQVALERVNLAIRDLLDMYCRAFRVEFDIPAEPSHTSAPAQEISCFVDALLVHVGAVHRLPPQWSTAYEQFIMVCDVYHGSRKIVGSIESKPACPSLSLYEQIVFDEWLQFSSLMMCRLPREARVVFTLVGTKTNPTDSKLPEAGQVVRTPLVWAVLQLFQFNGVLLQGSFLCGMWPEKVDKTYGPAIHNTDPYCPVVQVSLPDFGCPIVFPEELEDQPSQRREFESLDAFTQQQLLRVLELSSSSLRSVEENELLWDKRHYLYEIPQAVPRVLLAAHSWDWTCLSDIYSMLHEWTAMSPIDALELLLPTFPDVEVRKVAISWVKNLGSDELCDFLPQLVQALKYETWDNCATAKFLLERSLTSIRVAHHLYWLLKQNVDDPRCGHRIQLVLNAMLAICGRAMRSRFESQEELMQNLNEIAEKIKTTKDSLRLTTLLRELESIHYMLEKSSTSLPLSPSLEVGGIEFKLCSYFTSHTLPLKLSFKSGEEGAAPIEAIVKVGDDLRQDMLTIQMIRIMDKLCLKEGLDLRIVTFVCVATGNKKGVVEMVCGSETLRKIQTEHGLTGSFKDRPIAEWLQKHNPSELEYQQAVENFTYSCAGYSVATYVLGICDRHNDNIMLKTSGHLFHIDFGKFLGDSQMFGSIKRDRVPFVLTSDMAYVINGGDKPTSKFQQFVDLCCQAFNIVRKHGNLFLNLFALMASAGIPGVTLDAVSYIERALLPEMSDAEAAANFARMIEDSLKSWFTQFNFFIHNLAQLRFTGDQNDGTLLSFIPKTYSVESDGRIQSISVFGYQKRYDPEKYYVYVLKVVRESSPDPAFLFRSYREFWEFHQKLCMRFPLAKYHSLPRTVYLGRSNIHQVAEKRKAEIEYFLGSIWKMADEIKHCELVYTFLHPLLRDQQDGSFHLQKGKETRECRQQVDGLIHGEVKLSIRYHSNTLFIMVMHARNLNSSKATGPDPYVKTYLVPDHNKGTKRKTKVVRRNSHPTFMEMLQYKFPLDIVQQRVLQVSVWDYDRMVENTFLGATKIVLSHLDLNKETVEWYTLGNLYR